MSDSEAEIPQGAIQITTELINELAVEIINSGEERLEKFETMTFFVKSLPDNIRNDKQPEYGVAKILTVACSQDPLDMTEFEDSKQPSSETDLFGKCPFLPLVQWTGQHWSQFGEMLFQLKLNLKAKDCGDLENVMEPVEIFRRGAGFRLYLEQLMEEEEDMEVDQRVVTAMAESLEGLGETESAYRNAWESFLIRTDTPVRTRRGRRAARATKNDTVRLKPIQEIIEILRSPLFDLTAWQGSVETLMKKWAKTCLPSYTVYMSELSAVSVRKRAPESDLDPDNTEDEPVPKKKAKKAPRVIHEKVGKQGEGVQLLEEDEDSDEDEGVMKPVQRSPRRVVHGLTKFTKREREAIKIGVAKFGTGKGSWNSIQSFMEELHHRTPRAIKSCFSEMVETGEVDEPVPLGRENTAPQQQKSKPRENSVDPPREGKKRRRWTPDESKAIWLGVRELGVGNWAKIKTKYYDQLANRTAVQIKDRYRTMMRNGTA